MDQIHTEASLATTETSTVDFKAEFDPRSKSDWCELVKDIAAMANSGGGCIIFGIDDNGNSAKNDMNSVIGSIDPANIVNKMYSYTGKHYAGVSIAVIKRKDGEFPAFSIAGSKLPLVFSSQGNYQTREGRSKCAFSIGSVYFRHGAKSEPCTADDLASFVETQIERVREIWTGRLRMVTEVPIDSTIGVVESKGLRMDNDAKESIRLSNDPNAPIHRLANPNLTHPYRQKDVVKEVNQTISPEGYVSSHDILSVRRHHQTDLNPVYCYKGKFSVPTYSKAFIDWILAEYKKDKKFFFRAKEEYHIKILKNKKHG